MKLTCTCAWEEERRRGNIMWNWSIEKKEKKKRSGVARRMTFPVRASYIPQRVSRSSDLRWSSASSRFTGRTFATEFEKGMHVVEGTALNELGWEFKTWTTSGSFSEMGNRFINHVPRLCSRSSLDRRTLPTFARISLLHSFGMTASPCIRNAFSKAISHRPRSSIFLANFFEGS